MIPTPYLNDEKIRAILERLSVVTAPNGRKGLILGVGSENIEV